MYAVLQLSHIESGIQREESPYYCDLWMRRSQDSCIIKTIIQLVYKLLSYLQYCTSTTKENKCLNETTADIYKLSSNGYHIQPYCVNTTAHVSCWFLLSITVHIQLLQLLKFTKYVHVRPSINTIAQCRQNTINSMPSPSDCPCNVPV